MQEIHPHRPVLPLDSHNSQSARYSVFNMLTHRGRMVCIKQQLLQEEEDHVGRALLMCNYSTRLINRLQTDINHRLSINQAQGYPRRPWNNNDNNNQNIHIVVPYTKYLAKCLRVCDEVRVQVQFKGREYHQDYITVRSLRQGRLRSRKTRSLIEGRLRNTKIRQTHRSQTQV